MDDKLDVFIFCLFDHTGRKIVYERLLNSLLQKLLELGRLNDIIVNHKADASNNG
jgi:hypothetical protein